MPRKTVWSWVEKAAGLAFVVSVGIAGAAGGEWRFAPLLFVLGFVALLGIARVIAYLFGRG